MYGSRVGDRFIVDECFAAGAEWCGVAEALAAVVPSAEPPPDVVAEGAEPVWVGVRASG